MKTTVQTRTKEWTIEITTRKFKTHTYKEIYIKDNGYGWKQKTFTCFQDNESINNLNIPKAVKKEAITLLKKYKKEATK